MRKLFIASFLIDSIVKNLVEKYLLPMNSRVDLVSSTFGRDSDFLDNPPLDDNKQCENFGDDSIDFSVETAGLPKSEPIFGTRFWRNKIPDEITQKWCKAMEAKLPPPSSSISLPQSNPFIPSNFELKKLPADDSHHPLLFCSLKICVSIGKKKVSTFLITSCLYSCPSPPQLVW